MKKKILSLFLCTALALGALTGCGSSAPADTPANSEAKESEVKEEGASESAEVTTQSVIDKGVVELRLIFYGDATARRDEFFKKDFHDRILEELNIDLTVEFMPWGSNDTIATMLASGEAFAVENVVSLYDWPSKGYLAEIDPELIEALCLDLNEARGSNGYECVKLDGAIYAIPFGNKPYSGQLQAFDVRNDILNSVGYEADEIKTYDELMEAVAAVHEAYPDLRIIRDSGFLTEALTSLITDEVALFDDTGATYAYVREDEDSDKVYSFYESEAFKNLCKYTAEWAELGYIQMDELTNPTQGVADWEAGNCLLMHGMPGAYISTTLKSVVPEAEEKLILLEGTQKIKVNDYDWGISISAADKENVDRWLTLFNWIYQSQEHYNYCVYGVEGKDWQYKEDGTIEKLCEDTFFDSWFLEAIPFNIYDSSLAESSIEHYENWDNDSILSKKAGFTFDASNVSAEVAMMSAVYTEMLKPIMRGLLDFDENYEEAIKQLKDAGLDTYMEEYQRQFSEWYANK